MDGGLEPAVEAIDRGHAVLMNNLVSLVGRLAADGDAAAFAAALRRFVGLAGDHFVAEEAELMKFDGDLDRHRAEHAGLIDTSDALLTSTTTRFDDFDRWGVALYFLHWLGNHIRRQNDVMARHRPHEAAGAGAMRPLEAGMMCA